MNSPTNPRHPHDDLATYAVGALPPDEHPALERHLAGCARCRQELASHLATLAALTGEETPPAHLWSRARAHILDTSPQASRAAPTPRPAPAPTGTPPEAPQQPVDPAPANNSPLQRPTALRAPRRRPTRRIAALAAAAVLAAVLAVGFDRLRNNDDGPPTVTDLADAALLDPDSTVINLDHPDTGTPAARIVIDASGHAYLRLDSLAPLPPDEAYQLWRTEGTSPVSLAVLGPDTPNVVPVSVPAGTARLAITREPDQGSPVPTGPLVAAGTANA